MISTVFGVSGFARGRHVGMRVRTLMTTWMATWMTTVVIGALSLLAGCAPATRSATRLIDRTPGRTLSPAAVQAVGNTQPVPDDNILDVLTFNTALLPVIAASTQQRERAALTAPHLVGYDVLVLEELFVNQWRDDLLSELAHIYPYMSNLVGTDGAGGNPFRQDGGIIILSRWPIERYAVMRFGDVCSGTDCLADKGVAYAAVRKGRFLYHVFGTHAQSVYGFGVERIRKLQFRLWRSFIASLNIPSDEPVLLAGDFNVDAYTPELESMLATLDAVRPMTTGPNRFTWDPERNRLATDQSQWLDYVLVAADHAQPAAAWNRVVTLREGNLDLSDHYAVWGRVVMDDRCGMGATSASWLGRSMSGLQVCRSRRRPDTGVCRAQ